MNEYEKRQRLDLILRHLADEIDVSPTRYQEAKDHYNAVGEWLGRDDSELAHSYRSCFPRDRSSWAPRSVPSATRNTTLMRCVSYNNLPLA